MNKIEHLKEATKVVAEIQEKNDFSDAVCVATGMVAICLASYGFKDKMLDDAIDAIVKDIKNSMEIIGLISKEMDGNRKRGN